MTGGRLKLALGSCLLLGAAAILITLSRSPIAIARVNTDAVEPAGTITQRTSACQPGEVLPRGTSAVRLRVFAFLGPRVTLEALQDGRVIARGERAAGWTGGAVTVPIEPLATARAGVELCFTIFLDGDESNFLTGELEAGALAAHGRGWPPSSRLRVEYLRSAASSWWSLVPQVARRMGLGRAWAGTWGAVLVLVLMGGVTALCSVLTLRELR